MAGKEPKLAIEFARPTRLEDVIGIRAIDDVGCSFEHDNEAIGALSDVKQDLAWMSVFDRPKGA